MKAELAARSVCALGESPRWSAAEQRLYWVDVPTGTLLRLEASTGEPVACHREDTELGACTVAKGGGLLLFLARGAIKHWQGSTATPVLPELPDEQGSRFNDVAADAQGRVWCGTLPTASRAGRLYRLDTDGSVRCGLEGVRLPNGLCFPTPDRLVFADSLRKVLCEARYDLEHGVLDPPRTLLTVPPGDGVPDGLAVDTGGGLWCAHCGGGAVVRYSSDGRPTHRIEVPTRLVTALAFGGARLDELFITTAQQRGERHELGGALFHARPPYPGQAPYLADVRRS